MSDRALTATGALPTPSDALNEVVRREGGDGHPRHEGASTDRTSATGKSNKARNFARLNIPNGADPREGRQMGGGVSGRPFRFVVQTKKRGRHVITNGGFATSALGKMVALLVSIKIGEKVGGDSVLGRVAGKLDDGQRGGGRGNGVGSSDRITENQRDPNAIDYVPNMGPQIGARAIGGNTPTSTVLKPFDNRIVINHLHYRRQSPKEDLEEPKEFSTENGVNDAKERPDRGHPFAVVAAPKRKGTSSTRDAHKPTI